MKNSKASFVFSTVFLLLFIALFVLVLAVDVSPIGPNGSSVGLASLNGAAFEALGESPAWDRLGDILMLLSLIPALGFAVLGLRQLIARKRLLAVDADLLLLAALYVLLAVLYVFFELFTVNHRPILVDGVLEASFPSSHTLLVCTVLGSAALQMKKRLDGALRMAALFLCIFIIALSLVARALSGMHWITDIMASAFLSTALVFGYHALC